MYRLMLYFLLGLLALAVIFSVFGVLPYDPVVILVAATAWVMACWLINKLLARVFKTSPNPESALITGLILALIIGPAVLPHDFLFLITVSATAMASKYLLTFGHSHIFNPAAFGAVAGALLFNYPSSWWVGATVLLPFIVFGGIIITQKIRRWPLVITFLLVYLGLHLIIADPVWPTPAILFLTFVMLVEPLTAPQTRNQRIIFGALVAALLVIFHKFLPIITFPLELSLLGGNIFTRLVTRDFRQALTLARREDLAPTISALWFRPTRPFDFIPGQFLEYTLPHPKPDSRGVRRWFTIASAPTEPEILIVTRWAEAGGSSFKRALRAMTEGNEIIASKVAGDFTLPALSLSNGPTDPKIKLVFLAGGIGITPFRSMVKYLLDTNQSRNIVLLYSARSEQDFVFKDIFDQANKKFGLRAMYVTTPLDEQLVKREVPDWSERTFYISGPEPMVEGLEKKLLALGLPDARLKRDYFPGYE